jgi:hypothetical protein
MCCRWARSLFAVPLLGTLQRGAPEQAVRRRVERKRRQAAQPGKAGAKSASFAPFCTKNNQFSKTGSGQTQRENSKREVRFSRFSQAAQKFLEVIENLAKEREGGRLYQGRDRANRTGLHDWIFTCFNPHAGAMQDCSQCRSHSPGDEMSRPLEWQAPPVSSSGVLGGGGGGGGGERAGGGEGGSGGGGASGAGGGVELDQAELRRRRLARYGGGGGGGGAVLVGTGGTDI